MIWLWRDSHDAVRMADHVGATLVVHRAVDPDVPADPYLLRHGWGFWPPLGAGCALTFGLYLLMLWAANRWGIPL